MDDQLPAPPEDPTVDEMPPEGDMETVFNWMSQKKAKRLSIPKSRNFSRREIALAFDDAFHMIGGTTALAMWAMQNPDKFYTLYAKLFPSEAEKHGGGNIHVHFNVPPSKLDGEEPIEGEYTEAGMDD